MLAHMLFKFALIFEKYEMIIHTEYQIYIITK